MATNWKNLTPEQREVINTKRREKYANLPLDAKAPLLEKAKKQHSSLTPEQKEAKRIQQRDGARYDKSNWIARIERKMERHKTNWWRKIDHIQKWANAGSLYPWPSLQDKCAYTEAYFKALHVIGRKCSCCGLWEQFDNYWRITRKDDLLAWVPRTVSSMEKVVKSPHEYDIFCTKCAHDLRFFAFCWIFSPINGRDGYSTQRIAGPEYARYEDMWPEMYPAGWEALSGRIKRGEIKSLTCQIMGPKGKYMDTFIKANRFYKYNGRECQPIMWVICEEIGQFYHEHFPNVNIDFWGANGRPQDNFYGTREKAPGDLLITEGLRAWLLSTPPGPQQFYNPRP